MPILVISDIMCPRGTDRAQTLPNCGSREWSSSPDWRAQPGRHAPGRHPCTGVIAGKQLLWRRRSFVVLQEPCDQKNVYNLLRDAATSPPQQLLDFGQLLDVSASSEDVESLGGQSDAGELAAGSFPAIDFVFLARGCWRQLHRHSHHSMNLYVVVAVLNARITQVAALHWRGWRCCTSDSLC